VLNHPPLRRLAFAKLDALTAHDLITRLIVAVEFYHPAWFQAALVALRRGPRPDIEQAARLKRALAPETYERVAEALGLRWSADELVRTPQALEFEQYRLLISTLMSDAIET
jgi:hypothetical protein